MLVKNRIKKHLEFQDVIAKGKVEKSASLTMCFVPNSFGYTRIGISVPKKSGNAVIRNKIKRQVRAICASITDYSKSFDVVLIIRKAYDTNSFNKVKIDLTNLFTKIG